MGTLTALHHPPASRSAGLFSLDALGHPQVYRLCSPGPTGTGQAEASCRDVTSGGVGKCAQGLPPARANASGAATGALARPPAPGAPVRGWASMIYRPGCLSRGPRKHSQTPEGPAPASQGSWEPGATAELQAPAKPAALPGTRLLGAREHREASARVKTR